MQSVIGLGAGVHLVLDACPERGPKENEISGSFFVAKSIRDEYLSPESFYMLIRPATDRNHERAQLMAAGVACVAFDGLQRASHLAPKSGKTESFRGYTLRDSRQLGNPDEGT